MKKLNKYIMLFVATFALVSCVDDVVDTPTAESKAGEDVLFGLSLESTRTVYGPEDEKNNAYPVYWSNGDKVQIYSPECAAGRNNAEYSVKPVEKSPWAESLTKTGPYGVQWGEATEANFYSVYPSSGVTFEGTGTAVKATMNIGDKQSINYALDNGTYYAADMNNIIMYAQKLAKVTDEAVNLEYNPFSTVLEFELSVSPTSAGVIFVNSITLEATTEIAGDFTLTFDGDEPTVAEAGNNGKTITMNFAVAPELSATNTTLKAKMALMPISGVKTLNGWKVTVNVREGDNKTAKHTRTFDSTSKGLTAGMIHKVKLPSLTATKEWEYIPSNWMPQLPDYQNIFLTELSIPGAWYAGSQTGSGYQSTNSFSGFWDAGVRAFAVECRAYTERTGVLGLGNIDNKAPSRICLSGHNTSNVGNACSNTWGSDVKYISDIIKEIANQVANHKDEFAVLILSYADGGDGGHRALDYDNFLDLVQTEITKSEVSNIAGEITSSTTIENVLGQLIIQVNVDKRVDNAASSVNAMFAASPLPTELENKNTVYFSDLKYGKWNAGSEGDGYYKYTTTLSSTALKWCFSSANRTAGSASTVLPTYADRKNMLNEMMTYSAKIYEDSSHDVWFYFNVGGTQATSTTDGGDPKTFASVMNPWLKDIIELKTNGGTAEDGTLVYSNPSPLGIVMFNQCTVETIDINGTSHDVYGPTIIRDIIEMNNKFSLKHKAAKARSDYDGTLTTGGNAY